MKFNLKINLAELRQTFASKFTKKDLESKPIHLKDLQTFYNNHSMKRG